MINDLAEHLNSVPEGDAAAFDAAGSLAPWLRWYEAMGVDACLFDQPTNWPSPETATSPPHRPDSLNQRSGEALGITQHARAAALACSSLEELEQALEQFEGCALRRTANRLCFADGNPKSRIMIIGEAPGAQEDRLGKPFVGPSGQLLDRMLGTVELDRRSVWITNVIFWRPPGNRAPTSTEISVCQPFLERQIDILDPLFIVFFGGIAARALLGLEQGVTKLRGRQYNYKRPSDGRNIPALITFHPAYLLRQQPRKKQVWSDLLMIADMIDETGARSFH